jgi:predicted metal-dependent phosphotriesterase family hydrolase
LTTFSEQMAERGIGEAERERMFVANPARAFAFAPVS